MARGRYTPGLYPRQAEVMRLKMLGKTGWEISTILGICEQTVYFTVKNLLRRFDMVRETQLCAFLAAHPWMLNNLRPSNDNGKTR